MHLPLGEVAPVLGPAVSGSLGLAGLLVFVAGVALLGLHYGWVQTFGKAADHVAQWIRNALSFSYGFGSIDVGGPIAHAIDWANHAVESYLADGAESCLHAAAWCFDEAGSIFWWTVHETEQLALDTYRAFDTLVTVILPRFNRELQHGLNGLLRVTEAELTKLLHGAEHGLRARLDQIIAKAEHELHVVEHAIAGALTPAGYLEKEFEQLRAKFDRLNRRLSREALVALIGATIFDQFGLGGLRCPGWIRFFNKNSCGLGSLLADLAEGILAVMLVEDVCSIVHFGIDAIESAPVQDFMTYMTDVQVDLNACLAVEVVAPLPGPYYDPPPVQPYAALA